MRIKVQTASVNPIDVLLRAGQLQEILPLSLPAIPGSAAASIAKDAGARVIGTAAEANHGRLTASGILATTYGPGVAKRVSELAPSGGRPGTARGTFEIPA